MGKIFCRKDVNDVIRAYVSLDNLSLYELDNIKDSETRCFVIPASLFQSTTA